MYKNILICVLFFYMSFDLLMTLFTHNKNPKVTQEYVEQLYSITGVICFIIAFITSMLLFNNLVCMDKIGVTR